MKIAAVTITYNDNYKFNEWCNNYEEYKSEIHKHIIVDNNSNQHYLDRVKRYFKCSTVIQRKTNGGCTGAYNDGIKYALSMQDIDAVLLIANDIKLQSGAISALYKNLLKDANLGMVSPIILQANSELVEDFGCRISKQLILKEYKMGASIHELKEEVNFCEAVPGGINLATREFYEVVGLQDDKLFMYSDEVDMGLRAKKLGYKMASFRTSIAWHNHINVDGGLKRAFYTRYLTGRNKIYLARKHYGMLNSIELYILFILGAIYKIILNLYKRDVRAAKGYLHFIFGASMGFIGNMRSNKFSQPALNDEK